MKNNKHKKGSAIALCLIFATVLLTMGLAYSKMTQTSKLQTVNIDERIKLDYLAQGMTEKALLKFQLYPADFYACRDAATKCGDGSYLEQFAQQPEFTVNNDHNSISSFNDTGLNIQLASMTILTNQKWKNEVLYIDAVAVYTESQFNRSISKRATRLVQLTRNSLRPN